jgi:hypothetical protein
MNTGGGMGSNTGYNQVWNYGCCPGCCIHRVAGPTATDVSCRKGAFRSAARCIGRSVCECPPIPHVTGALIQCHLR